MWNSGTGFYGSSATSTSMSSSSSLCQTPSDAEFYCADDDENVQRHKLQLMRLVSAVDDFASPQSLDCCSQPQPQCLNRNSRCQDGVSLPQHLPCSYSSTLEAMPLLERITRTHPVWYLPGISQQQAELFLANHESGVFLVHQSKTNGTLHLSVRVGDKTNCHRDIHTTTRGLQLDSSQFSFSAITLLITHYCCSRDDMPVTLTLPRVLMECDDSSHLHALTLLGADFWQSSLCEPSGSNARNRSMCQIPKGSVISPSTCEPSRGSVIIPSVFEPSRNDVATSSLSQCSFKHNTDSLFAAMNGTAHVANVGDVERHKGRLAVFPRDSHLPPEGDKLPREGDKLTREGRACLFESLKAEATSAVLQSSRINGTKLLVSEKLKADHQSPDDLYFSSSLQSRLSDYEDLWSKQPPDLPSPDLPLSPSTANSMRDKDLGSRLVTHSVSLTAGTDLSPAVTEKQAEDRRGVVNCLQSTASCCSVTCHILSKPINHILAMPFPVYSGNDGFSSGRASLTDSSASTTVFREKSSSEGYSSGSVTANGTLDNCQQQLADGSGQPDVIRRSVSKEEKLPRPLSGQGLLMGRVGEMFSFEIDLESLVPRPSQSSSLGLSSPMYMEPYESPTKDRPTKDQPTKNWSQAGSRKLRGKSKSDKVPISPASRHIPLSCGGGSLVPLACSSCSESSPNNSRRPVDLAMGRATPDLRQSSREVSLETEYREPFDSLRKSRSPVHPLNQSSAISNFSHEDCLEPPVAQCCDSSMQQSAAPVQRRKKRSNVSSAATLSTTTSDSSIIQTIVRSGRGNTLRQTSPSTQSQSKVDCAAAKPLASPEISSDSTLRNFPKFPVRRSGSVSSDDSCSADDLLNEVVPNASLTMISPLTIKNVQRMSAYENVGGMCPPQLSPESRQGGGSSHAGTVYCEPWDARPWYQMMSSRKETMRHSTCDTVTSGRHTHSELNFISQPAPLCASPNDADKQETMAKTKTTDTPYLTSRKVFDVNHPSGKVHQFITSFSTDGSTVFGATVLNFIRCTKEGQEKNPFVVLRNVRQFISGIKNYLLQHGEVDFAKILQVERSRLSSNEFVNMDLLMERSLQKCVVKPLKRHLYNLLLQEYNRTGSLTQITENINSARLRSPDEIGLQMSALSHGQSLDSVVEHLSRVKRSYSPLGKMESLLAAAAAIDDLIVKRSSTEMDEKIAEDSSIHRILSHAEAVLPVLVNALIQMGYVTGELDCDYMWGLLHPSLLTGNTGYQLTTFGSAVLMLKNLHKLSTIRSDSAKVLPSAGLLCGVLKLLVPDERSDSLVTCALPVRLTFTAKDVCMMLANRLKASNAADYELSVIVDGQEQSLNPSTQPCQLMKSYENKETLFVFKRINARFLWPMQL